MKMHHLNNVSLDPGAPMPRVLSSDTLLYLIFYGYSSELKNEDMPQERNTLLDSGVVIVKFEVPIIHKFGSPGDETLSSHPFYDKGLKGYAAQYVEESPWLEEMDRIESVHPYYEKGRFKEFKHYIFCFHDNTFECIAKNHSIITDHRSMYDVVSDLLADITAHEL